MASRDLNQAQSAFESRDIEQARRAHNVSPHASPVVQEPGHAKYSVSPTLRQYAKVVGQNGTFGLSLGLSTCILWHRITGCDVEWLRAVASLCIGVSGTLGLMALFEKRAEQKFYLRERAREEWELANCFEGECLEMVEIYVAKGLAREDAEQVVRSISKTPQAFVDIMMMDELMLLDPCKDGQSPLPHAAAVFLSALGGSLLPLLPWGFGRSSVRGMVLFSLACSVGLGMIKRLYNVSLFPLWKLAIVSIVSMSPPLLIATWATSSSSSSK